MSAKYLFITTHFEPDFHYGGVIESSVRLYKYLRSFSQIRIATVSSNPESVQRIIGENGRCYRSLLFHRFGVSLSAIPGLAKDVRSADAVLINGIFTFPVTIAQLYSVLFRKPFVVATRGGLEPWRVAHKKWKKFLYIKCITLPLMRKARFIHVTSDMEEMSIRQLGFNNLVKVTNGIDLEMYHDLPDRYAWDGHCDKRFIFLFLSRTDREKGLNLLIEAYRRFRRNHDVKNHILLIVGPDHQGYLRSLDIDYDSENIRHISGVYGEEKIKLIRRADVVVLPSYSENFGNIIAEALACERPVITTTGTPWREIETVGCGLYIRPNSQELLSAMESMYLAGGEELDRMGKLGRDYIIKHFSWAQKAQELHAYLELLV